MTKIEHQLLENQISIMVALQTIAMNNISVGDVLFKRIIETQDLIDDKEIEDE